MKISKLKGSNKKTGVCNLAFDGDLDIYAAEETLNTVLPFFDEYKIFSVDLSKVVEIDSSGIQIILQFHRQSLAAGGRLTITSWSPNVQELATLYQLIDRFDTSAVA
ncbi:MAG: STAS domain-containing protein [Gammaproteobacteria bacterium]|nr:STAS domain-containing protein [Gammaproteobacteria bacterium]MBQ0840517.1 STAS domain-containing protein [Gammaproteobacteria bacterium]